jgi:hypothetical protein
MVDERGPHEIARVGHPLGKLEVFGAGRGIAARMIVNEDERARSFAERDPQGITQRCEYALEPANSDAASRPQAIAGIEGEDPQLFVIERREVPVRPKGDRGSLREMDCSAASARDRDAPS